MRKHVLQWHVTHICNLECKHCYQEDTEAMLGYDELSDIFFQYMDFIKKYNYRGHINFTGGEPFICPHIFELFDMCEAFYISFGILTNGTLLDWETVNKLKKYKKLSFMQVSLDGTRETHDDIRGTGNFDRALNGLKLLRKAKIQTMVSFTCHKENYKELSEVIKIVKKNKIDRFWTDRLIPIGSNIEQILDTEQYQWVIETLGKEKRKADLNPFCKTTIHLNRALQFCGGEKEIYQCSAGKSILVVLADGELVPCRRMPVPLGNVLKSSIIEIYESSDIIKELDKQEIPEECEGCDKAELCRGGEKCLSYAVTGKHNIKDINCFYNKD
jgi:radical SAM protein with 4Fe4S-binding SPASM domain